MVEYFEKFFESAEAQEAGVRLGMGDTNRLKGKGGHYGMYPNISPAFLPVLKEDPEAVLGGFSCFSDGYWKGCDPTDSVGESIFLNGRHIIFKLDLPFPGFGEFLIEERSYSKLETVLDEQ